MTGFAQERIRKMPQKGRGKKLCHSKIDSLLLPDSFCVEGESAAGLPRLRREEGHEGHNERSAAAAAVAAAGQATERAASEQSESEATQALSLE